MARDVKLFIGIETLVAFVIKAVANKDTLSSMKVKFVNRI